MQSEGEQRGRPRVWESTRKRQQEHRRRKAAVYQAALELIVAALNTDFADPELQQQLQGTPDDLTVLRALTAYCRRCHWDPAVRRARQGSERGSADPSGGPAGADSQKPLDNNQRRVQRMLGATPWDSCHP